MSLALTIGAVLGLTSACALAQPSRSAAPAPECPATVEEAASLDFPRDSDAIGDDTFVGTGYAVRFVPSPDPDFRGYDLNVTRWLHGRPGDTVIFLLSAEEIPGIDAGEPVLIIVEETTNRRAYTYLVHALRSNRLPMRMRGAIDSWRSSEPRRADALTVLDLALARRFCRRGTRSPLRGS